MMKPLLSHSLRGALLFFVLILLLQFAYADEWSQCIVQRSTASDRDSAIAMGRAKTRISFFRKVDYGHITIFLNDRHWASADLIPTGRRAFGDGRMFNAYADKRNSIVVQRFEGDESMIVNLKGDVDFTLYAECK